MNAHIIVNNFSLESIRSKFGSGIHKHHHRNQTNDFSCISCGLQLAFLKNNWATIKMNIRSQQSGGNNNTCTLFSDWSAFIKTKYSKTSKGHYS